MPALLLPPLLLLLLFRLYKLGFTLDAQGQKERGGGRLYGKYFPPSSLSLSLYLFAFLPPPLPLSVNTEAKSFYHRFQSLSALSSAPARHGTAQKGAVQLSTPSSLPLQNLLPRRVRSAAFLKDHRALFLSLRVLDKHSSLWRGWRKRAFYPVHYEPKSNRKFRLSK